MRELRCLFCGKLLCKIEGTYHIEIKCSKCKNISEISERPERQTN